MKKSHKTIALIFAFFAAIVLGNINFFINTFRNNYAIFDLLGGFHSINDPDIFVSYENWNNFDFLLRKNEIKLTKKVNKQYLFINTSKPFRKVYILQNIDGKLDFHLLKGDCNFSISNDRLQINIDIDDIYIRKNIINTVCLIFHLMLPDGKEDTCVVYQSVNSFKDIEKSFTWISIDRISKIDVNYLFYSEIEYNDLSDDSSL